MPDLTAPYQIAGIVAPVLLAAGWWLDRRRARRKESSELERQVVNLSESWTRQFGRNGFVLHERIRAIETSAAEDRKALADHLAQHVDRSFGR